MGIHEDVVYAWDRKPSSGGGIRPQPLWVNHLIDAWLQDPSLLGTALATALAASRKKHEGTDEDGMTN